MEATKTTKTPQSLAVENRAKIDMAKFKIISSLSATIDTSDMALSEERSLKSGTVYEFLTAGKSTKYIYLGSTELETKFDSYWFKQDDESLCELSFEIMGDDPEKRSVKKALEGAMDAEIIKMIGPATSFNTKNFIRTNTKLEGAKLQMPTVSLPNIDGAKALTNTVYVTLGAIGAVVVMEALSTKEAPKTIPAVVETPQVEYLDVNTTPQQAKAALEAKCSEGNYILGYGNGEKMELIQCRTTKAADRDLKYLAPLPSQK